MPSQQVSLDLCSKPLCVSTFQALLGTFGLGLGAPISYYKLLVALLVSFTNLHATECTVFHPRTEEKLQRGWDI